jgi:hypothetical protein
LDYDFNMSVALDKVEEADVATNELITFRDLLVEEKRRVEVLLHRVEHLLGRGQARKPKPRKLATPRPSPLDQVRGIIAATKDLRLPNGKLSADRVARVYGISLSQLAAWLGRTKQALSKTPDAASLQNALGYFERIARLRAVTRNDAEFRKWLRMPNDSMENREPLELIQDGLWQEMADKADDILTGMPT